MKTKAELLGEISELAEKHGLELPSGLKGLNYPAVEELLGKLQAQVAGLPAAAAPAPEVPEGTADAAPSSDAVAAAETPPAASEVASDDEGDGDEDGPQPAVEQPPSASELPEGHKRPSVEEFVKAGYKAENYEAAMTRWELELAARLPKPQRFVVAPGRSLCGARGMLGPGARVRASDFTGESKLEDFVRAGYVVEA